MAKYDSLGTRWRFTVYPGRLGIVYGVDVEGIPYRIAPDSSDKSKWRIDKAPIGNLWEAVNRTKYPDPESAAADLVRLYQSGGLKRYASGGQNMTDLERNWGPMTRQAAGGITRGNYTIRHHLEKAKEACDALDGLFYYRLQGHGYEDVEMSPAEKRAADSARRGLSDLKMAIQDVQKKASKLQRPMDAIDKVMAFN